MAFLRNAQLSLALLACCASAALAQPARTLHVKLSGNIDCIRQVEEFRSELADAKRRGLGLLAIELDGKAARTDLALLLCREVRDCGVPSVAWLTSTPGGSVGAGQALIAMAADGACMSPRTSISASPDDLIRFRELLPETDWDRAEQELVSAVWKPLEARGADPQIAYALAAPAAPLWAVSRGEAFALTSTEPAGDADSTQVVFAGGNGFERLHVDAVTALRLKMIAGTAQSMTEAASRSGFTPGARTTHTVRSGLHSARQSTIRALRAAAVEVERIDRALDVKGRLKRIVTDSDYREAGESALARIRALDEGLAQIDRRLEEYPELLVVQRAPGSRATRPPSDSIAGQLAAVRKDLEDLRVTATEYATRR